MNGFNTRPVLLAGLMSASMLVATQAHAVFVEDFDVTAGGGWIVNAATPTCDAGGAGGSGSGGSCVDESIIGGLPSTFLTIAWEDGGNPQSSLSVDWNPSTAPLDAVGTQTVTTNAGPVATSIITHENIVINPFDDHVDRLLLAQSFGLDVSAGGAGSITGGPLVLPTIVYDVQFAETLNAGVPCEAGGGNPCQDIFILRNLAQVVPAGPIPFEVCSDANPTDCWNYNLEVDIDGLIETTVAGLALEFPNLTIDMDGLNDDSQIGYFITSENAINTLQTTVAITATHDPVDVPEPTGLAIVGFGLLAAGAARARRA